MSTDIVIPMEDSTKESFRERCTSVVHRIKQQKENRQQIILPLKNITEQNAIHPQKRCLLKESDSIRAARIQSYSNWPHSTPSREAMSLNGWFHCKVNDRVLCIYCNSICHGWTNTDDPHEVHAKLAPTCPFVLSKPLSSNLSSIVNNTLKESLNPSHPTMCEITRRQATFQNKTWILTSAPNVDDLVRAGFFYSGAQNTVTCFYCNGALHQWGANDDPMIEHARWFPHCTYAKHLCGDRFHAKIQISKKQKLITEPKIDKEALARLVNARIDLPVVQRLRTQYRLGIIKRCIEDQLKITQDDFASDTDLSMACCVLQKQIDIIQGDSDKLIIPSQNQSTDISSESSNLKLEECLVCLTEERQLACMPCGHLCACVPCGYALRSCPVCREKIQSFLRVYC